MAVEHARGAADAVRELNLATLGDQEGWEQPGDAYDVIGGLDRMAGMLPQSIDQTWALLARVAADGRLASHRDVGADLPDTQAALMDAKAAAQRLKDALGRAHVATNSLYADGEA